MDYSDLTDADILRMVGLDEEDAEVLEDLFGGYW